MPTICLLFPVYCVLCIPGSFPGIYQGRTYQLPAGIHYPWCSPPYHTRPSVTQFMFKILYGTRVENTLGVDTQHRIPAKLPTCTYSTLDRFRMAAPHPRCLLPALVSCARPHPIIAEKETEKGTERLGRQGTRGGGMACTMEG